MLRLSLITAIAGLFFHRTPSQIIAACVATFEHLAEQLERAAQAHYDQRAANSISIKKLHAQVDALVEHSDALTDEALRAESVAGKLRALVS